MNNRKLLYISVPVLVFGGIAIHMQSSYQQGERRYKEANAKTMLGGIHRAQQVYHLERDRFTDNYRLLTNIIDDSSTVAPVETGGFYKYKIPIAQTNVAVTTAKPKPIDSDKIRQFVGITYRNSEDKLRNKICATKMGWFTSSTIPEFDVEDIIKNNRILCPNKMEAVE